MKKILIAVASLGLLVSSAAFSEGGKKNNPLDSIDLEDGCVLIYPEGYDKDTCSLTPASPQSGQQFLCDILMVCPRDSVEVDD